MKITASVHAANQKGGKTVSTDRLDALIVADGTCPQIRSLLAGAQAQIHWLTGEREALSSISSLLDKHPCRQLNLVGHGRGGAIRFGPEWIHRKDLLKQADRLAKWDLERIALWSCELGQDSRFATTLEYLTGAQVFSSRSTINRHQPSIEDQRTGAQQRLDSIISPQALMQWDESLGTVAFTPANVYLLSNVSTSKVTPTQLVNNAIVSQADPVQGENQANGLFTKTSGNNLLVSIIINGTTIRGDIQRRVTTGNTLEGLVFFQDVNNDGTVPEGGEGGAA